MNLTQWREGAKAQRFDYCAVIPDFYPVIPAFYLVIPAFCPVIPAKAGIQRVAGRRCGLSRCIPLHLRLNERVRRTVARF